MPCEIIKVSLKPVNFFDRNPAIDVAPSTQEFNQSTLLSEAHHQGGVAGTVGEDGRVCCEVDGNGIEEMGGTNGTNGMNGTNGSH